MSDLRRGRSCACPIWDDAKGIEMDDARGNHIGLPVQWGEVCHE